MKRTLLMLASVCLAVLCPSVFAAAKEEEPEAVPVRHAREPKPVRNPFWPQGYEGERTVISADSVVVRPDAAVQDDEAAQAESGYEITTSRHWVAARKTLKIGGTIIAKADDGSVRTSVVINGYPYTDGDLLSVTHDGRRFTWRIGGLSDNSVLKLIRVRVKRDESAEVAAEEPKGTKQK